MTNGCISLWIGPFACSIQISLSPSLRRNGKALGHEESWQVGEVWSWDLAAKDYAVRMRGSAFSQTTRRWHSEA